MFVLDDIERRQCSSARHGVAAKRVEITRRASELFDDPGFYDDPRDRMSVPHRLAHGDDIGDDLMPLESPHCLSGPCEAGLNFVGDEESSLGTNGFDGS